MAYQIPRMGGFVPAERARGPRLLDAAIAQQAQSNALRQGKETEKANRLKAGIQIASAATGEGGWLSGLGAGEDAVNTADTIATADDIASSADMMEGMDAVQTGADMQGLEEGDMLASADDGGGMGKAMQMGLQSGGEEPSESGQKETDALQAVGTIASLASGNPMGLIGLAKLFKQYS